MVAGQEEPAPAEVRQGEGEHPAELLDALLAPLLVSVYDDLGVGVRHELVPFAPQLLLQFEVVVHLAVVGDPQRPVLVRHRLVAALRVNDGEPAVAEGHVVAPQEPDPVRPAVGDGRGHPLDLKLVWGGPVPAHDAGDSTHRFIKRGRATSHCANDLSSLAAPYSADAAHNPPSPHARSAEGGHFSTRLGALPSACREVRTWWRRHSSRIDESMRGDLSRLSPDTHQCGAGAHRTPPVSVPRAPRALRAALVFPRSPSIITAAVCSHMRRGLNSLSMRRRFAAPSSARRDGSATSRRIRSAKAPSSPGGARNSYPPGPTASRTPGMSVAANASPAAILSKTPFGLLSARELNTPRSAAPRRPDTSCTSPRKRMLLPSSKSYARAFEAWWVLSELSRRPASSSTAERPVSCKERTTRRHARSNVS